MGAEASCCSTDAQRALSPHNSHRAPEPYPTAKEPSFNWTTDDAANDFNNSEKRPNYTSLNNKGEFGSDAISKRSSTMHQINENVIEGFKNAIQSGNDSLMRHIYEEYCHDYNFRNVYFGNGNNALHMGCELKNAKMVKFILDHDICDVNSISQNSNGYAALHIACMKRDYKMVKLLVHSKYNANLTIECNINSDGTKGGSVLCPMTPVDIAKKYRCDDIADLIQSKIDKRNRKNNMPNEQSSKKEDSNDNNSDENGNANRNENGNNNNSDNGNNSNNSKNGSNNSNLGVKVRERKDTKYLTKEEKEREERELELLRIQSRDPLRGRKMVAKTYENDNETQSGSNTNNRNRQNSYSYSYSSSQIVAGQGKEIFLAKQKNLPVLKGALEKKQPQWPYAWQKRYVCIKERYMIWNDHNINDDILNNDNIYNVKHEKVKKQFNGYLTINVISKVAKYEDVKMEEHEKDGTKVDASKMDKYEKRFVIVARDRKQEDAKRREYVWHCETKEERNAWIEGIEKYRKFYKQLYEVGAM